MALSAQTVRLKIVKVASAGMQAGIYDPQGIKADAFDADNQTDGLVKVVMTAAERTKLAGIAAGATVAPVTSVAGRTGAVTLTSTDVGLPNVNNTSDANKPVSTAQATAIALKATDTAVVHNTGAETVAGVKTFSSAPVVPSAAFPESAVANLTTDLAATEKTVNKGAVNGYASLDGTGKIPSAQIPAIALSDTFVVASQAAMLALTAQRGDVAIRTDTNITYILSTDSPTTLADWKQILTPAAPVQSVNGYTGTVVLVKGDVGLGNVDNTSDVNKPVSTAQQAAIDLASGNSLAFAVALG